MEIFSHNNREEYIKTQIERSNSKFSYSKVSIKDAEKYYQIIKKDQAICSTSDIKVNHILCLGTRNGREVDLFRLVFFQPTIVTKLISWLEIRKRGFKSMSFGMISLKRSRLDEFENDLSIGVEINPRAKRKDIWIGSFDEMPDNWEQQYDLVYSNSFDQSQDPYKTSKEWWRVLRPGGYLIFAFNPMQSPTKSDPVGKISISDVQSFFPEGELVYYSLFGSENSYTEIIFRKP
jgi:hypothetical protein